MHSTETEDRIRALEDALKEYIERYGMTDRARRALLVGQKPAPARVFLFRPNVPRRRPLDAGDASS